MRRGRRTAGRSASPKATRRRMAASSSPSRSSRSRATVRSSSVAIQSPTRRSPARSSSIRRGGTTFHATPTPRSPVPQAATTAPRGAIRPRKPRCSTSPTPGAAAGRSIDLNGVILLSQILNFDLSPDRPTGNPGIDLPYQTVLPSYAAAAWYHRKLPAEHPSLDALLKEVEQFAMGEYARALAAGSDLPASERAAIAEKLHQYTGLPVDYILKADLRIDGGEVRQNLQSDGGMTTGRLDSRFSGPDIDPLSQRADYDPQSAALSSAYVSALNDYVRRELHYGDDRIFKPRIQTFRTWNFAHQQPGHSEPPLSARQGTNVMPDLANAMKLNPNLKVQLNAGYFDLATPFYQGVYEMHHLPIPQSLQANIEYCFYESGHMVYAKDASLRQLHDNVADFIRRTSNGTEQAR